MKRNTTHLLASVIFLMSSMVVIAYGQQGTDDAAIAQMRGTVQRLEGLVGDANIPPQTQEQLNELLFEKRGELHALLRQKRDALRASLRSNITAKQANAIAGEIQRLDQQLRQIVKASTAPSAIEDAHPQITRAPGDSFPSNTSEVRSESTETVRVMPPTAPETTTRTDVESPATRSTVKPAASTTVFETAPAASTTTPVTPPAAAEVQEVTCPLANTAGLSAADAEYVAQLQDTVCRIFRAKQPGARIPSNAQLSFETNSMVVALALGRSKLPKIAVGALTAQAEDASNAKSLSSGDSGSGSTSLVAKGSVPAILGFATEHGGLTRTADGTTVTFTGNPVGLVQAMAKVGFIDGYQNQDDFTKFLRKLSFGLSFDTSRGDQAGVFTGNKQQLSGFSFRYNAVNHRDPREKKYTQKWLEFTNEQASNLALAMNNFVRALSTGPGVPALTQWLASANQALSGKTSFAEIKDALETQLANLEAVELPADQKVLIEQVGTDFDAFITRRNEILDEINNGWIATFDYTNTRPVGTPSLSSFRFVAEKGAYNGSIDFTGNASVTIYNSRPTGPNAKTLRDFRFAGQLDVPVGDISKTGIFLISLAGRYQRLLEDEPILGSTLVVPKGDIATFQAKLTIPIRGTAFKIPLSFSYANRTELIKERELRANFGFTFDLDSIFARFNPFTQK